MDTGKYKGKRLGGYVPDYVVFDLETTGVSVMRDDIIEVSAVKVKNHKIEETFSHLVNPGRRIPAGATAVNGITDEMVAGAPTLERLLPDFLSFIGEDILIGHNIRTFDLLFLDRAVAELTEWEIHNDYIDTLYLARACLPELSHHRLTDLAEHFKISTEGAHRALNDCMMNQACYEKMGKMLESKAVPRCPKCGSELYKRNGKFGPFYGCANYPACRYTQNIR